MGVQNFWAKLPKPFFVMAPLANVTDAAFRRMIAKYSKFTPTESSGPAGPDVNAGGEKFIMYTEFVSADGLMKGDREVLIKDLMFSEAERPIVAQFFTGSPQMMEQAAALAAELGFDGVDINMGCPDRSVEKTGGGAAVIKNPKLAQELIAAAKRGAPNLPVSLKTRFGYNKDILDEWLPVLLQAEPAAITIHARTRKEMSKVPARWERIKKAVEIREAMKSKTLIIGNGDLKDLADAQEKIKESGADGAMLGRAIFGRPNLFSSSQELWNESERLRIMVEHTKLFEELLGEVKNFAIMKKHFKAYAEGFPGAKELRIKLMETENAAEVEEIVKDFLRA